MQNKLEYRNKLAKKLNARMRSLESHGVDYGAIEMYYDYINQYYSGKKRISEHKQGMKNIDYDIAHLEHLLSLKSSTYRGVKSINMKRISTFEKKYGIKFKNEKDFHDFIKSEAWKNLSKLYGSKVAIALVSKSKKTPKQIQEYYNKYEKTVTPNDAKKILKSLGFENAHIATIVGEFYDNK